jgi:putative transposase
MVAYVISHHGYSERRACRLVKQHRSVQKYRSVLNPRTELRQRMKEIAGTRVRYGYRRIQVMLKREGWPIGKNLMWRLYKEEGLALRKKLPRRRKMVVQREARFKAQRANDIWSLDFVADEFGNGQRFRALTVVDVFTREALAIDLGVRLRAEDVVRTLNRLVAQRGKPRYLFADNGSEFTGRLMDLWAYHQGTRIDFSRPGKPTDNAFVETFNGSLRDECLNVHWFESLEHAREIIEQWRLDYNESRPHMALGNAPPSQFARQAAVSGTAPSPTCAEN